MPKDDELHPNSKLDTIGDTAGDAWKRFADPFPPGWVIVGSIVAIAVLGIILDIAEGG